MCPDFPLKGWPADVISNLKTNYVPPIVAQSNVQEFYIGRTDNLVASRSRHGADDIIPLYETDSADNAIQVEEALIQQFYGDAKCSNENDHAGGGASDDYVNYVYIALWYVL
ncbi:MAG: hypothetical protein ACLPY5_16635 [Candidatus Bathyarchaeia archaeon]